MAGWVNGGVAESLRFLNHNFCPAACCCLASPPFKLEKAVVIPKGSKLESVAYSYGCRFREKIRQDGGHGIIPESPLERRAHRVEPRLWRRRLHPQAANSQAAGNKANGCAGALAAKCPCGPVLWPEIGAGQI